MCHLKHEHIEWTRQSCACLNLMNGTSKMKDFQTFCHEGTDKYIFSIMVRDIEKTKLVDSQTWLFFQPRSFYGLASPPATLPLWGLAPPPSSFFLWPSYPTVLATPSVSLPLASLPHRPLSPSLAPDHA